MKEFLYLYYILAMSLLVGCGNGFVESTMFRHFWGARSELKCLGQENNAPFAFGDGSIHNPFGICNATQLNNIGSDLNYLSKSFILLRDIDLSGFDSNNFNLIGTVNNAFVGTFEGGYKKISNFKHHDQSQNHIAFFVNIGEGGLVRNLSFDKPNVEANQSSAVMASIFNGELENIIITNALLKVHNYSGGVVARSGLGGNTVSNPRFYNVRFHGQITGKNSSTHTIGGITATAESSILKNVATDISITQVAHQIGGLIGQGGAIVIEADVDATINSNGTNVGGALGYAAGEFFNINVRSNIIGGSVSNDFGNIGGFAGTIAHSSNPNINIGSLYISNYRGSSFTIDQHKNIKVRTNIAANPGLVSADSFGGIVGLSLGPGVVGEKITYQNLKLEANSEVIGNVATGGLIGYLYQNNHITESKVIDSLINGHYSGGGFGLIRHDSILQNIAVDGGLVTSSNTTSVIGGFAGAVSPGTQISKSYTTASLSGIDYVAGFAGAIEDWYAEHGAYGNIKISECFAAGEISSSGDYVAGFSTSARYADIESAYFAEGNITGLDKVSAFIQDVENTSLRYVFSSPASFNVTGSDFGVFALISDSYNPANILFENAWFNVTTTGIMALNAQESSFSPDISLLSDNDAKDATTFSNWDPDTWVIEDGDYPKLRF